MLDRPIQKIIENFASTGNGETCHQSADKQTSRALNCWRQIVLQTAPIPSNHACNRIGSNYNVQRDRRQFLPCKKAERKLADAIISVRAVARIISPLSHLARVLSHPFPLSLSFSRPLSSSPTHLRCTAAKRVARAANANPISENNFSRRRILARLFKTSDLTGSCCGTRTPCAPQSHPPSPPLIALYSPSFPPVCTLSPLTPLVLLLSCRPIFSVPPLNRARFSQ